jgi:hypothetical protein
MFYATDFTDSLSAAAVTLALFQALAIVVTVWVIKTVLYRRRVREENEEAVPPPQHGGRSREIKRFVGLLRQHGAGCLRIGTLTGRRRISNRGQKRQSRHRQTVESTLGPIGRIREAAGEFFDREPEGARFRSGKPVPKRKFRMKGK